MMERPTASQEVLDYIQEHDHEGYDLLMDEIDNQIDLIEAKNDEIIAKKEEVTALSLKVSAWANDSNFWFGLAQQDYGNPFRKTRYDERIAKHKYAYGMTNYYNGLTNAATTELDNLERVDLEGLKTTLGYLYEGLEGYYTSIANAIRIGLTDPGALASAEQVVEAVKQQNKQDINLENKKKMWFYIGGTIVIAVMIIFIFILSKSLFK